MQNRPVVTSFLVLTALAAIAAAPRLMPEAVAVPADSSVIEIATPVEEPVVPEESALDERDAVAEVVAEVAPERPVVPKPPPARRDIDLVIALDTSGSMEGLLDSARARLWDIVNAAAEKDPNARIRVALLTFGSPGVAGPHEGYVKVRSDLTTDLDSLYAQIMALHTDGGEEYVGWTVHTALNQLSWSSQKNAAHIMFVAGNESADQGRGEHDFRTVAQQARERGVVINAMFAGDSEQGRRERWAEVAEAGGGFYSAIDQGAGTYQVASAHDAKLAELNDALNATYVGYGVKGAAGKANQMAQDANAVRMGSGSIGSRVSAKSRAVYDNASWDLVDGADKGLVNFADDSALPAPVAALPVTERAQFVSELKNKRDEIKKEIAEVSARRKAEAETQAAEGGLDEAVIEALEDQL